MVLRADVYRPDGPGTWPTLLVRTPYDKGDMAETLWNGLSPIRAAEEGFMVVAQDTRGRYSSDGDWEPLEHEGRDGFDTVEWAARLPGSNGRVGMFGGSYCGNAQWMAAIERPPSLSAISPFLTWSDPADGLVSRGGAVELGLGLTWPLLQAPDWLGRQTSDPAQLRSRIARLCADWEQLGRAGYWHLPVSSGTVVDRSGIPSLGGLASEDQKISQTAQVAGRHGCVQVPSFNTAGWFDVFLQGALDNYEAMSGLGEEAWLEVGPWAHEQFHDPVGGRIFGLQAARDGVSVESRGTWSETQLTWFRSRLDPTDSPIEPPEKRVRIFVMGVNRWREEKEWPPARAERQRWLLRSDGTLSQASERNGIGVSQFIYDPEAPVPTVGGQALMWPGFNVGSVEQSAVEGRTDVLTFTSAPLERPLEVTGRVRVYLHARSSAISCDWVARLCDVNAAGESFNLCDGILRVPTNADQPEVHEIDLWSVSNVFLPGHRVRVQVTSSCFPRWDRNLSTGHQELDGFDAAGQSVFHLPEKPSFIDLPVIHR